MNYDYEYFKAEVYKLTTIDLNLYKERQMKRRIDTLIERNRIQGYDEYIKAIKKDKNLFHELFRFIQVVKISLIFQVVITKIQKMPES